LELLLSIILSYFGVVGTLAGSQRAARGVDAAHPFLRRGLGRCTFNIPFLVNASVLGALYKLNNIQQHSSTCSIQQHSTFNSIQHSTTFNIQQHSTFNNIQVHAVFNNIQHSTAFNIQQHSTFNSIQHLTAFSIPKH
jgi:hypothetical protein